MRPLRDLPVVGLNGIAGSAQGVGAGLRGSASGESRRTRGTEAEQAGPEQDRLSEQAAEVEDDEEELGAWGDPLPPGPALEQVADHLAAEAVVAHLRGWHVAELVLFQDEHGRVRRSRCVIWPSPSAEGELPAIAAPKTKEQRRQLRSMALIHAAGPQYEHIGWTDLSDEGLDDAWECIEAMDALGLDAARKDALCEQVSELLFAHQEAVVALAEEIMEQRALSAEDIVEIIEEMDEADCE